VVWEILPILLHHKEITVELVFIFQEAMRVVAVVGVLVLLDQIRLLALQT
jgi:hypothetical protein